MTRRFAVAGMVLWLVALLWPMTATASPTYPNWWPLGSQTTWRYTADYDGIAAARNRGGEAFDEWNALSNESWSWNNQSYADNYNAWNAVGLCNWAGGPNPTQNAIHMDHNNTSTAEDAFGYTWNCDIDSDPRIDRSVMVFLRSNDLQDKGYSGGWHFQTSWPSNNEIDFRSAVAHEAGHWTGMKGHFSYPSSKCEVSGVWATMCPGVLPGDLRARDLTSYDMGIFYDKYL